MSAMKQLGNAGTGPLHVTQVEGGVEQTYTLLPGETLVVPLSDGEATQQQADITAAQQAATKARQASVVAAWVQLRMIRDRWLAQTDYIDLYLANPSAFTLPTVIANAITSNGSAWQKWRQQLRDLPAQAGVDPVAAIAAVASVHATSDTFPAPWPQPPAAPVIHLT